MVRLEDRGMRSLSYAETRTLLPTLLQLRHYFQPVQHCSALVPTRLIHRIVVANLKRMPLGLTINLLLCGIDVTKRDINPNVFQMIRNGTEDIAHLLQAFR
jgi:hypothetical protein